MKIRRAKERGYEDKGWLEAYHTFSFENYYDPKFMNFQTLRVLNEVILRPGKGFSPHTHKEMEILTLVVEGAVEQKDSLGNTTVIQEQEISKVSAGRGISFSESNLSHHMDARFYQIWISPKIHGTPPSFTKKLFSSGSKWGQWCLMISGNGREGSIPIHQDVNIYSTLLDAHDELHFETLQDRYYFLQVLTGKFTIDNECLLVGDGMALEDISLLHVKCEGAGELLLFDIGA